MKCNFHYTQIELTKCVGDDFDDLDLADDDYLEQYRHKKELKWRAEVKHAWVKNAATSLAADDVATSRESFLRRLTTLAIANESDKVRHHCRGLFSALLSQGGAAATTVGGQGSRKRHLVVGSSFDDVVDDDGVWAAKYRRLSLDRCLIR